MGWKLVRDRTREWGDAHGVSGTYREASELELTDALERKLGEELMEYLECCHPAELYDLLDVLSALLDRVDPNGAYAAHHEAKVNKLGCFENGVLWNPVPAEFLGDEIT